MKCEMSRLWFPFFLFLCALRALNAYTPHHIHPSSSSFSSSLRPLLMARKNNLQSSRELQKKVETYIRLRDLKQGNNSNALSKEDIFETTKEKEEEEKGYKKFVGKGTLDQRLRAVIAYKRESLAIDAAVAGFSRDEEEELRLLDSNDDEEEEEEEDGDGLAGRKSRPGDDLDAIYEREIQRILEQRTLSEMQRNMEVEKNTLLSTSAEEGGNEEDKEERKKKEEERKKEEEQSIEEKEAEEAAKMKAKLNETVEYYVPSRSSWGVFERPRDISKTYGGPFSFFLSFFLSLSFFHSFFLFFFFPLYLYLKYFSSF